MPVAYHPDQLARPCQGPKDHCAQCDSPLADPPHPSPFLLALAPGIRSRWSRRDLHQDPCCLSNVKRPSIEGLTTASLTTLKPIPFVRISRSHIFAWGLVEGSWTMTHQEAVVWFALWITSSVDDWLVSSIIHPTSQWPECWIMYLPGVICHLCRSGSHPLKRSARPLP
jgi:hypothetical protein